MDDKHEPVNGNADKADIDEVDVNGTDSDEADTKEADTDETDIDEADADEMDIDEADTDETDIDEADTDETDIDEADADEMDIDEADTDETDIDEADTDGMDIDEADTDEMDIDEEDTDELDTDEIEEEDLITRVRQAAKEGAMAGHKESARKAGSFFGVSAGTIAFIFALISIILLGIIIRRFQTMDAEIREFIKMDQAAKESELVLEDNGFFGHRVADFQEAILGDSEQLKKLEVYTINVSEVVQISMTGLANLKVFSKFQLITYSGSAVYTVDLAELNEDSITLDEDNMMVHIKIPHAELERINIPEDGIEYSDVLKGLLAIGDLKITPEEVAEVQSIARTKMTEKLEKDNVISDADRFAKLSVWEIYQPVIDSVATGYSLEVEFAD